MGTVYLKQEAASPPAPSSGSEVVYYKADGLLYRRHADGTEELASGGPFDYDNRFSNPNGTIDQRNAGAAATVNSTTVTYGVDRWFGVGVGSAGVFTMTQEVTAGEYDILLTCTTADASLAAGDLYYFAQRIEGYNVADLRFGQSDAKQITISFEVKCSQTGTFPIAIRNSAANRSYVSSFVVNAADTWESKSVTFTADTSGTWLYTNGIGLTFSIGLGVGSTYEGTAGAWAGSNIFGVSGYTNFMSSSTSRTMRLRKFRLRPGKTAMPFVQRLFDAEFNHCRRYFETNVPYGTAPADGVTSIASSYYPASTITSVGVQYIQSIARFLVPKRAAATGVCYRTSAGGTAGTPWYQRLTDAVPLDWSGAPTPVTTTTSIFLQGTLTATTEGAALFGGFWWAADAEL